MRNYKSSNLFKYGLIIICMFLLNACRINYKGSTENLVGLQRLSYTYTSPYSRKGFAGMRKTALEEIAMSLGAQAGLAYRAAELNIVLEKNSKILDRVFNFHPLLLDHSVLPPVLLEGRHTLNLDSPETIRISDRTYQIAKQARFVTAPPNWRNYVWLSYQKPERPHNAFLPRTRQERRWWAEAVTRGWYEGRRQADYIFGDNLSNLKQDYLGMIRYRILLAQNMVTLPFVAKTDLGVTGNSEIMYVHDQILRIMALPSLNIDSSQWQPLLSVAQLEEVKKWQVFADKFVRAVKNDLPSVIPPQASVYSIRRNEYLPPPPDSYKISPEQ